MSDTIIEIMKAGETPMINKIQALESEMVKMDDAQIHIEPVHHFAEGLYAREITIPAGVLLTGKIHKYEHLNIISKGRIAVWTEEGMQTISAPATIASRPGMKRLGYALEDTVWTTIHATDYGPGDDLELLEEQLVCNSFEEFELFIAERELLKIEEA